MGAGGPPRASNRSSGALAADGLESPDHDEGVEAPPGHKGDLRYGRDPSAPETTTRGLGGREPGSVQIALVLSLAV